MAGRAGNWKLSVSAAVVKLCAGAAVEPKARETLWTVCTLGLKLSVTNTPEALSLLSG